jgi:hypothetical protein
MVSKIPPKPALRGEGDFYRSLKEWGSHNEVYVDKKTGRDPFHLGTVLQTLFVAYCAILEAVQRKSCELAQRRGVDTLIKLAFAFRLTETREVGCVCVFLHYSLTQEM